MLGHSSAIPAGGARGGAESASALPGESASALPGESGSALPGESGSALPGLSLNVCSQSVAPGQAACLTQQNMDILPVPNAQADPLTIEGYQPKDLQTAYALPSSLGGQTVAIVDAFDNPMAELDLATYRATFGLPPCTTANGCFSKVNQNGETSNYPAANTAWGKEIALDVEMVSAVCPNCKIVLVEADSASVDDLAASVDRAVALGAHVVSNSYAAPEWAGEVKEEVHFNHPGVAITVASGDSGVGATYPASSAYVTAVGGTVLTGSNGAYVENSGWKNAGRGCSQYIAKPAWQHRWYCANRASVDVAALADPASGVAVYDSFVDSGQVGGWIVAGGTSVGAPVVAGAYALANDLGAINGAGRLYARWRQLHDVPPAGWDYNTGLGSPSGVSAF
jgi:subtilase family serine protease